MPGIPQKDIDASDWGVKEWRVARQWNFCFLIAWIAFYGWLAVLESQQPSAFVWLGALIFAVGLVSQMGWLIRVTVWLGKQK